MLAPGAPSIRVLHVSDIHLVPRQRDKIAFLRDLATTRPDLVIDTGDNLAHRDSLGPLLEALAPLLGAPGAFVLGSNDYYAPQPKSWSRYLRRDPRTADRTTPAERDATASNLLPSGDLASRLREAGWRDLTNRRDRLAVLGTDLDLVGVDDPHLDRDAYPAHSPLRTGALRVGVAHAPYQRVLHEMHDDGARLVLAGHTHGGQLALPWFGALVTNCDLDRRRAKGLHGWPGPRPDAPGGEDSLWLHVSAGLGTSPYAPVRFACRPEATLLELVPAAG